MFLLLKCSQQAFETIISDKIWIIKTNLKEFNLTYTYGKIKIDITGDIIIIQ